MKCPFVLCLTSIRIFTFYSNLNKNKIHSYAVYYRNCTDKNVCGDEKNIQYQNYKQNTCSLYFSVKIKTCFVKSEIDSRNYIPSLQYKCINFYSLLFLLCKLVLHDDMRSGVSASAFMVQLSFYIWIFSFFENLVLLLDSSCSSYVSTRTEDGWCQVITRKA